METTTRMPRSGATLPETLSCRNPATRREAGRRADLLARRRRRAGRARPPRAGALGPDLVRRAPARAACAARLHRRAPGRDLPHLRARLGQDRRRRDDGRDLPGLREAALHHRARRAAISLPSRAGRACSTHKAVRVEYHPLGVVGVLCPWNFPFHNVFCPVIPALFAGNAVVVKVSEWTSWSAADFQAIFDEVLSAAGH